MDFCPAKKLNHWPLGHLNEIFRHVIFKQILVIDGWGEIAIRWMSLILTDDKSILVQVMAWCRQAASHYLSQCWLRSLSSYGVTRPQKSARTSWHMLRFVNKPDTARGFSCKKVKTCCLQRPWPFCPYKVCRSSSSIFCPWLIKIWASKRRYYICYQCCTFFGQPIRLLVPIKKN